MDGAGGGATEAMMAGASLAMTSGAGWADALACDDVGGLRSQPSVASAEKVRTARARRHMGGKTAIVGRMTANIPDKFLPLLTEKKALAHLATIMPDGSPQVTPVWFFYRNGRFEVNTARGRVKDRNMSSNALVALSIVDPENPYAHIAVRGKIVKVTEEGADASIDALALKYMGQEKYPFRRPGEVRVLYEIEPLSVAAMG